MSNAPVLACEGLTKTFEQGAERIEVLRDIALSILPGESVAVIGASGSGKSTLLHLLAGLDRPTAGWVSVCGSRLDQLRGKRLDGLRNRQLGFVFQFHFLLPDFSALENAAMPLLIGGVAPAEAKRRAQGLLEHLGLSHRLSHHPGRLSGGECQRVALARALVTGPACIIADEPTGNLDAATTEGVFRQLLDAVHHAGTTLLLVTHDRALASRLDRTLELHEGRLLPLDEVERTPSEALPQRSSHTP